MVSQLSVSLIQTQIDAIRAVSLYVSSMADAIIAGKEYAKTQAGGKAEQEEVQEASEEEKTA